MSRIRILLVACIVAGTSLAAPRARAADVPRLVAYPVGTVAAGSILELRWSRPADGVEEVEVLLSVDGGHTYPIRVTPSLGSGEVAWRWRLPDVPCAEARLRVRALVGGLETPGPPTPPFRITASADASPGSDFLVEGFWWRGGGAPRGAGASALLPPEPVFSDGAAAVDEATSMPDAGSAAPAGTRTPSAAGITPARIPASIPVVPPTRSLPMRN
jgi:hypothetical protein